MVKLDPEKIRQVPGWKDAPIHICMDADYRGLTFCCKPGYSLTFAYKCKRDEVLKEIGMTPEEFIKIKEDFSKENRWDSELVCFGSLSYCCMRRGGCPRRDPALLLRYPNKSKEEIMEIYFAKKKELSRRILEAIKDPEGRKKVEPFLELF
ncbi:MAG: methanogenesis marker 9 domain-containing protein [Candidatus Helarchaeota archaeon]